MRLPQLTPKPGRRARGILTLFCVAAFLHAGSGWAAEPPVLFLRACAPCHGKDGKAGTPAARKLGVKDMTRSTLTEAQIRQQILDGKKGPDGTLKMPSFEQTLKPDDIESLARFARSLQVTSSAEPPSGKR